MTEDTAPTPPPAPGPAGLPDLPGAPRRTAPRDAREVSRGLFRRLAAAHEGTREHQYVRHTLIELHLTLVRSTAGRLRGRTDDREDIVQVGTIGLIKAIDRFEVSREVEFAGFAVPYIAGEIKRFFRDATWAVHVPRQVRELRAELRGAAEELSARLGREPTGRELAAATGHSETAVTEARLAGNGYRASSLDSLLRDDTGRGGEATLADLLGAEDPRIDLVERRHSLMPLLARLDDRQRRILRMRFGEEMTQAQIGKALGISQMHVSRLLTRTLEELRAGVSGTS